MLKLTVHGDKEIDGQALVPYSTVPKDKRRSRKYNFENSSFPGYGHFW